MTTEMLRFDGAWSNAIALVREQLGVGVERAVLIRDLLGRIRLAYDDRERPEKETTELLGELAAKLDEALGAYSPGSRGVIMLASMMFAPNDVFESPDLLLPEGEAGPRLLDRMIVGADWTRDALPGGNTQRLALFGIKGGVGRSTATAALAWKLAQLGRRVMVVDLDLESPGVSSTLLPAESQPSFGVVDWLVEAAAGQANHALLLDSIGRSPLASGSPGEIQAVPAGGRPRDGYSYLPKLARAYADLSQEERAIGFGERLGELIQAFEKHIEPDITILDSRAGLHDIAAVVVTRLGAHSLLFAVDSRQTWDAFQILFSTWNEHMERVRRFRDNLQMVAAMVPETGTIEYLDSFTERSYELYLNHLYDEVPADSVAAEIEGAYFSYDVRDASAPHYPVRINWSRALQQFDPVQRPESLIPEQIESAFGELFRWVEALVSVEATSEDTQ